MAFLSYTGLGADLNPTLSQPTGSRPASQEDRMGVAAERVLRASLFAAVTLSGVAVLRMATTRISSPI
jgi:hypothetical protein